MSLLSLVISTFKPFVRERLYYLSVPLFDFGLCMNRLVYLAVTQHINKPDTCEEMSYGAWW